MILIQLSTNYNMFVILDHVILAITEWILCQNESLLSMSTSNCTIWYQDSVNHQILQLCTTKCAPMNLHAIYYLFYVKKKEKKEWIQLSWESDLIYEVKLIGFITPFALLHVCLHNNLISIPLTFLNHSNEA